MSRRRKFWSKHLCQDSVFDCSVSFSKYWRVVSKQSNSCRKDLIPRQSIPNTFYVKLRSLHFDQLFSSYTCPVKCRLSHLPSLCLESSRKYFDPSHCPFIFSLLLFLSYPILRYFCTDLEKWSLDGRSRGSKWELGETPVIVCLRCQHVSRRLQEESLVSKQTHVHLDVRKICFNLQIQWYKVRVSNIRQEQNWNHFSKDLNYDICLKTKITMTSCRRRTGTVVSRAVLFEDLITADHKVLGEESESRNNHRYVVRTQDLTTQWMQPYPYKSKSSQEIRKNLVKFLESTRISKVIYTDNSTMCDSNFAFVLDV